MAALACFVSYKVYIGSAIFIYNLQAQVPAMNIFIIKN